MFFIDHKNTFFIPFRHFSVLFSVAIVIFPLKTTTTSQNKNILIITKIQPLISLLEMNTLSFTNCCDEEKLQRTTALAPERPASPIFTSDYDSDDDRIEVISSFYF
jgi:hypothetical protein